MKKKIFILILILLILILLLSNLPLNKRVSYTYNPELAVEYSYKYIEDRNPEYPSFEFNCINYISQCLVAGGITMDAPSRTSENFKIFRTHNKWFSYAFDTDPYRPIVYNISSAFSKISDFVFYWSKVANVPYYTMENTKENQDFIRNNVKIGDVIIVYGKNPHSVIVVDIDENTVYYNSNTNDRNAYPLYSVSGDRYEKISYFNFVK